MIGLPASGFSPIESTPSLFDSGEPAHSSIFFSRAEAAEGSRMTMRVAQFLWQAAGARLAGPMLASAAFLALGALFDVAAPLALGRAVDLFSGADATGATLAVCAYVGALGAARMARALNLPFYVNVERRMIHAVSRKIYAHALDLPHAYHLTRRTGELGRTISDGVNGCRRLPAICSGLLPMAVEIVAAAGVLLHLFDFTMLAAYGVFVAAYGAIFLRTARRQRESMLQAMKRDGNVSNLFLDSLLNFETVKAFVAERAIMRRLGDLLDESEKSWFDHFSRLTATNLILALVFTLSFGGIFALAIHRLAEGGGRPSDLLLIALYLNQVLTPIEHFTMAWRELFNSATQVERMLDILAAEPESALSPGGRAVPGAGPVAVRVEGLWHSHHTGHWTLRDVSFEIPAGRTLALVGPSGAGKSTLVRLLFRFHTPERGAIFVDDVALEDIELRELRGAFALVPQDCVLFNETLIENIRFARPDATREEVAEAMRAAGLDEAIARLPQGEETIVGERGLRLSGGEKQRVAIARALLKRPRLLVLDEATSSLDTRTERLIQERIVHVAEGVTRFIVAHRLSTIVDADEIIVLEEGAIVERGAHDALLAANGRYAQMWAAQRRDEAEAALEPEPA
jgi:ATP-binding cassette subfamily B protein